MIQYKQGNLLSVTEGVIVHGCNAQGVMGSGVALAVKSKYPKAYDAYIDFKTKQGLRLASLSIVKVTAKVYVANLISQETYGKDKLIKYVSYGAIHLGFEKLHGHFPISAVFNFPKIGAGLGNGDWKEISKLIELACPERDLVCWEV